MKISLPPIAGAALAAAYFPEMGSAFSSDEAYCLYVGTGYCQDPDGYYYDSCRLKNKNITVQDCEEATLSVGDSAVGFEFIVKSHTNQLQRPPGLRRRTGQVSHG